METNQSAAIERVRTFVRGSDFYPPRERQSLLSWASNRGHGALRGVISAVFDAGADDPFSWDVFGVTPFFEEPAGDSGACAVILVSVDSADIADEPVVRRAVVVSLDLDGLRGREGLVGLVECVIGGLQSLAPDTRISGHEHDA